MKPADFARELRVIADQLDVPDGLDVRAQVSLYVSLLAQEPARRRDVARVAQLLGIHPGDEPDAYGGPVYAAEQDRAGLNVRVWTCVNVPEPKATPEQEQISE